MAVTVKEMNISRKLGYGSCERRYSIRGATDEAEARTGLLTFLGAGTVNGMTIDYSTVEVEEFAELMFYGTATWKFVNPAQQPPSSFHISFDITAQTQHITQSKATINTYVQSGATAYNFKGAIGVDEDGTVQGVDILVPFTTFQINYTFEEEDISDAYIATLTDTVGAVNSDSFHEFAAGVLLLTKVSGQKREDKSWDLSFGFSVSKNATGVSVGDITGISKKGWEYMWVYYKTVDIDYGGGLKKTHKVPFQANVEKVYPTATFSTLGV